MVASVVRWPLFWAGITDLARKKKRKKKKKNTYKTQLQKNPMYGDLAVFLNAAQRWSIAVF